MPGRRGEAAPRDRDRAVRIHGRTLRASGDGEHPRGGRLLVVRVFPAGLREAPRDARGKFLEPGMHVDAIRAARVQAGRREIPHARLRELYELQRQGIRVGGEKPRDRPLLGRPHAVVRPRPGLRIPAPPVPRRRPRSPRPLPQRPARRQIRDVFHGQNPARRLLGQRQTLVGREERGGHGDHRRRRRILRHDRLLFRQILPRLQPLV